MAFPSGTYTNELAGRVRDEFEALYSVLQGWLRVNHNPSGTHGNMQADAIAVSGVASFETGLYERNRSTRVGEWTSVTYAAGNFTASGSMTWTVDSGDVSTYAYTLVGKTMKVAWYISGTDVGGTPSTALQLAIPTGVTAAKSKMVTYLYADAGGARAAGYCTVAAGGSVIQLYKMDGSNWTATSSDNTDVFGEIDFEVS